MKKKVLAGLTAAGLLAGGISTTALAAGAPAASATTRAVASSTSKAPVCGPLGSLVAKGTITHAQAVAIHDAFVSYARDHWSKVVDTVIGQEVMNHTITKAQANAVTRAIAQWIKKYQGEEGHHGACHHGQ